MGSKLFLPVEYGGGDGDGDGDGGDDSDDATITRPSKTRDETMRNTIVNADRNGLDFLLVGNK